MRNNALCHISADTARTVGFRSHETSVITVFYDINIEIPATDFFLNFRYDIAFGIFFINTHLSRNTGNIHIRIYNAFIRTICYKAEFCIINRCFGHILKEISGAFIRNIIDEIINHMGNKVDLLIDLFQIFAKFLAVMLGIVNQCFTGFRHPFQDLGKIGNILTVLLGNRRNLFLCFN